MTDKFRSYTDLSAADIAALAADCAQPNAELAEWRTEAKFLRAELARLRDEFEAFKAKVAMEFDYRAGLLG